MKTWQINWRTIKLAVSFVRAETKEEARAKAESGRDEDDCETYEELDYNIIFGIESIEEINPEESPFAEDNCHVAQKDA